MADTRISGMTDATTLTGAESVPAVQGGANVKTTAGAVAALAATIVGPPGQSYGSALLSGCLPAWTSALNVTVSGGVVAINGTVYQIAQTDLTFDAADVTNPRIDDIVVNTSGVAAIVKGTAAANPAEPAIDPLTQLRVSIVLIPALASALSVTVTNVYLEDTEWTTTTSGGTIVKNSTNNPFAGTKDVEATAAANGDYVEFDKGSTFDQTTANLLTFRLRSKATWPNAKSLVFQFRNSAGVPQGQSVTIKTGAFGYNSSTLSYLLVAIPIANFGIVGLTVQKLRATVTGSGGTIGWYLDNVIIQGGIEQITNAGNMNFRGAYSAVAQYTPNDVVKYGNGLSIANAPTLGNAPGTSSWSALSGQIVVAAAYNATLTVDLANYAGFRVVTLDTTMTGDATFNLTNGTDGQVIVWRVLQDSGGSHLFTAGANIRFGTDITSITLTTTASKMDRIAFEWNGTAGKADVIAFVKGY